jgi:hypothetical protein
MTLSKFDRIAEEIKPDLFWRSKMTKTSPHTAPMHDKLSLEENMFTYFASVLLASAGVSYLSIATISLVLGSDAVEALAHLTLSQPSNSIQSAILLGLMFLVASLVLMTNQTYWTKKDHMRQFEIDAIPAHSEIQLKA